MAKTPAIVAAIEIGTSQINVLVGEVTADSVSVIGRGSAPSSEAVVKGEIRNMELAGKALEQALSQADDSSGNMSGIGYGMNIFTKGAKKELLKEGFLVFLRTLTFLSLTL